MVETSSPGFSAHPPPNLRGWMCLLASLLALWGLAATAAASPDTVQAPTLEPTPAPTLEPNREQGSLVGEVLAPDGAAMGSVRVLLDGPGSVVEAVSDERGRFRFPALQPGGYSLEIVQGDETIARYQPVAVRMGRPTTIKIQVRTDPDGTLVVTSEPPEPAVRSTTTPHIDGEAVGLVAADRDPFRAAQNVGVEVSTADAVDGADESWRLDGVPLSDAPAGTLPSGVRIQILSSADAARGTADPVIDLLSPEADDGERRAEVDFGISDRSWNRQSAASEADRLEERLVGVADAGLEGSLQLVADRLWGWGSLQTQDVTRRALGGQETRTENQHLSLKLQANVHSAVSVVLSHHGSERRNEGEGAGLDRSLEATSLELAPSRQSSLSSAVVVHSNLSFDLRVADARDAASLLPQTSGGGIVLDSSGVWQGGFAEMHHREDRQQMSLRGDADFRRGPGGLRRLDHRLRFGYQSLESSTADLERWGADNLQFIAGENFGTPYDLVRARRSGEVEVERRVQGLWIQDSISRGRFSLDLGLRMDRQSGRAKAGQAEAHAMLPELLPALAYDGRDSSLEWVDISPRLGLSWALTRDRDTILRLSRASFASRLHSGLIGRVSPLAGGEVLLAVAGQGAEPFGPAVTPGGGFAPPASFAHPDGGMAPVPLLRFIGSQSLDVLDPVGQANAFAAGLRSERVDDLGLSLEHHLGRTELVLSFTDRVVSDVLERRLYLRDETGRVRVAQNHDYRLETVAAGFLPDGAPYAVPVYGLAEGLTYTGGSVVANGDRRHHRQQTSLGFHRRLSGGFQLRGHVTWTDWRWDLGSKFTLFDDPTDEVAEIDGSGVSSADGAGDASSLGRHAHLGGRWSFDVMALYQVASHRPWGFDVGASVHGREGYELDYTVESVSDRTRQLDVTAAFGDDRYRLDDVLTVDLRLQKDLRLGHGGRGLDASLALDIYNLLDEGAVLERETSLTSPTAGDVRRTLSPRVFQLGLRLALP